MVGWEPWWGRIGRQEPRRIMIEGCDHTVTEILSRGRIRDSGSGIVQEVFVCRIDHRTVRVCVFADGTAEIFTYCRLVPAPI